MSRSLAVRLSSEFATSPAKLKGLRVANFNSTPVIGGNVGGIRYQIEDGVNGFVVASIEEAAERIMAVINNNELPNEMGHKAREIVRKNFFLTRYLEQHLDLFDEL
jgi:trehalose synthase